MSSSVVRSSAAAVFASAIVSLACLRAWLPGQRLDAAHAGGDRAFAGHRDQADIAGAPDMGAAAQFDRPAERVLAVLARGLAHRDHADLVAVFFAEQRAGAGLAGIVHRHQARGDFVVLQHHLVGDVLDAGAVLPA